MCLEPGIAYYYSAIIVRKLRTAHGPAYGNGCKDTRVSPHMFTSIYIVAQGLPLTSLTLFRRLVYFCGWDPKYHDGNLY